MPSDNAALVAAYWREHRLSLAGRVERLEAQEATALGEVTERISRSPQTALSLLDDLLTDEAADLSYLGAGPLEDLLVEHGPLMAEGVAARCRGSSRWATAVSAVWLDDSEWASVPSLHPWLPKRR